MDELGAPAPPIQPIEDEKIDKKKQGRKEDDTVRRLVANSWC